MADIYLRSTTGSDANDGSTWALAKATLAAAMTAAGAGGTVYVSASHAESTAAAITLTSAGTLDTPMRILCVDDTGDPQPPTALATTAVVETTGQSAIVFAGTFMAHGISFYCGDGLLGADIKFDVNNAQDVQRFVQCKLVNRMNHASYARLLIGAVDGTPHGRVLLEDTTVGVGNSGGKIVIYEGALVWRGGGIDTTYATPNVLLYGGANARGTRLLVEGVDLSSIPTALVDVSGIHAGTWIIRRCKIGATLAGYTTGTAQKGAPIEVRIDGCDSGDSQIRIHRQDGLGTTREETTIVRSADVGDGGTKYSLACTTTAYSHKDGAGAQTPVIPIRVDTPGTPITITVGIVHDSAGSGSGGLATSDDIQLLAEYSENLNTTQDGIGSTGTTPLSAPTEYPTTTGKWVTTGLTAPLEQELSITVTPQEVGFVLLTVMMTKPSATVYISPEPVVT